MAQQQPGAGGGGGGGDSAYGPVWVILIIFIVGWALWHYLSAQIVAAIFAVCLVQAKVVALFTSNVDQFIYIMETVDPKTVSWAQVVEICRVINQYYVYPVCAFMAVYCVVLYSSDVTRKYKKKYDMKKLREQECHNWSQIMPVVNQDLINQDISKGPWAMAESPMEFTKKHNLLKRDEFSVDDPEYPGVPLAVSIKRAEAKAVFTLQLGAYWEGFDKLPPHLLALCAIFAARINKDRDKAYQLIDHINKSVEGGNKPDFGSAKVLMQKHMNSKLVQKCTSMHAYILTMMASLLVSARDDGVMASADFLWLKPIDRRAWYMLNSVGRQTPYVEVSGLFAHWKAERALKRKSMVPLVEEAVKALEASVKEVKLPIAERRELS
jgi:intracellular multiplication protein IcmP